MNDNLETNESIQDNSELDNTGESWSRDNPLPVEIIEPSDSFEDIEEETISVRYLGEETEADPIVLENIKPYVSNSKSSSVSDFKNLWKLKISGSVYDVLFPQNASLEVVDGKLYNTGSNNITGIVIDSSFSDSSYSNYTITVLPVSSNSTQNTVYRYGSRIYITSYSVGTGYNLVTNVSYVQPTVESRPIGWNLTPRDWIVCGLLLLSVLVTIMGGLFRR